MVYIASKVGMRKGYWKVINKNLLMETVHSSGIRTKKGAEMIAYKLNMDNGFINPLFCKRKRY